MAAKKRAASGASSNSNPASQAVESVQRSLEKAAISASRRVSERVRTRWMELLEQDIDQLYRAWWATFIFEENAQMMHSKAKMFADLFDRFLPQVREVSQPDSKSEKAPTVILNLAGLNVKPREPRRVNAPVTEATDG